MLRLDPFATAVNTEVVEAATFTEFGMRAVAAATLSFSACGTNAELAIASLSDVDKMGSATSKVTVKLAALRYCSEGATPSRVTCNPFFRSQSKVVKSSCGQLMAVTCNAVGTAGE